MVRRILLGAACTLAVTLVAGCEVTTSNQIEEVASEVKHLGKLNAEDPSGFLERNFQDRLGVRSGGDSLKVVAIDAPCVVELARNGGVVVLKCELVSVSQAGDLISIGCNSHPMSLEDSIAIAMEVCAVSGMEEQKIVDWHQSRGYSDALDPTCFVSGNIDGNHSSVEIRRSFEASLPWRVLYEISYGGIAGSVGERSGRQGGDQASS